MASLNRRGAKILGFLSTEKEPTIRTPLDEFVYENRLIHPEEKLEPLPPAGPSLIDVMQRLDDIQLTLGRTEAEEQEQKKIVDAPAAEGIK